jgi:hypothetical protein
LGYRDADTGFCTGKVAADGGEALTADMRDAEVLGEEEILPPALPPPAGPALVALEKFIGEQVRAGIARGLRLALVEIVGARNPKFEADCLALTIGLPVRGNANQAAVSGAHGVTAAAVSKCIKKYATIFPGAGETSPWRKRASAGAGYRNRNGRRQAAWKVNPLAEGST